MSEKSFLSQNDIKHNTVHHLRCDRNGTGKHVQNERKKKHK